jgi:hypothetical protein
MSLVRVQQTSSATLSRTFYVDETPTDAAAGVSVTVTRPDGTAVTSGSATLAGAGTGRYTFVLPGGPAAPGSATWQLDTLTVAWAGTVGGAAITLTDTVEVVGGFLFSLTEARNSDPALMSSVMYPTALLAAKRIEVEQECERICRQAFVPRFARRKLNGDGSRRVQLPHPFVRRLRAASVAWVTGSAQVPLGTGEFANIAVTDEGQAVRGFNIWPSGVGNVVVEYEHGWDGPPADIVDAALTRMRTLLARPRSGVPDRVASYTNDAGTFRVSMPGPAATGIPDVDAVYHSYRTPLVGA